MERRNFLKSTGIGIVGTSILPIISLPKVEVNENEYLILKSVDDEFIYTTDNFIFNPNKNIFRISDLSKRVDESQTAGWLNVYHDFFDVTLLNCPIKLAYKMNWDITVFYQGQRFEFEGYSPAIAYKRKFGELPDKLTWIGFKNMKYITWWNFNLTD